MLPLGSGLTREHLTRPERLARDKGSSLFGLTIKKEKRKVRRIRHLIIAFGVTGCIDDLVSKY